MILPGDCWSVLKPCLEGKARNDFVITRLDGSPLKSFHGGWRKLVERAGMPGLHCHDLRRSAARNMIRAGIPKRVVMDIVGWKTRAMLDRYNIVDERDLAQTARTVRKYASNGYAKGYVGKIKRLSLMHKKELRLVP